MKTGEGRIGGGEVIPDEEITEMRAYLSYGGQASRYIARLLAERELLVAEHEASDADNDWTTRAFRRECWQAVEDFK